VNAEFVAAVRHLIAAGWESASVGVLERDNGETICYQSDGDAHMVVEGVGEFNIDTIQQAVDLLCVLGLLPAHMSTQYRAGVTADADAIEKRAESIGWYEGGGAWVAAINAASEVAQ
jgi:hypothetical protein